MQARCVLQPLCSVPSEIRAFPAACELRFQEGEMGVGKLLAVSLSPGAWQMHASREVH